MFSGKCALIPCRGQSLLHTALNQIYPDTFALSLPFLLASDEEFDYVFNQIEDYLQKNIEDQGYKIVTWTNVGWVYIFAKEKVVSPSDLRQLNLATTDSDKAIAQALKASNFNAIPVGLSEVLTGLNSGMIDACYTVKNGRRRVSVVRYSKSHDQAPHGAGNGGDCRVRQGMEQGPRPYKAEMLEAADDVSRTLARETAELEREAMRVMLDNGLIVHDVPPATEEKWRSEFEDTVDMIKGETFSVEVYNRIRKHIDEYRSRYGKN